MIIKVRIFYLSTDNSVECFTTTLRNFNTVNKAMVHARSDILKKGGITFKSKYNGAFTFIPLHRVLSMQLLPDEDEQ